MWGHLPDPVPEILPPEPERPRERPLALEARKVFLTWARTYLDAEDFVVPGSTEEEEDDRGEFYREHNWRYLWFLHDIIPEGMQGMCALMTYAEMVRTCTRTNGGWIPILIRWSSFSRGILYHAWVIFVWYHA
jgi:hypothetical protein